MDNWRDVLVEPAKVVLAQMGQFFVSAILVILILLIGSVISRLIKTIVTKLLKVLKLDELSSQIGLSGLLTKSGISHPLSALVGGICYWLALLITFVVALNSVGLTIAADLLQRISLFIPNIIAAIFILIVGMFAAVIMKNIVKTTANNIGISQVNILSKITEVVIMVFAISMSLEQLQIGAGIVRLTITIILGSFGLGFALALGLGCKDMVAKSAEGFLEKLKKQ
ncbi:MAG: hypothetical protein A2306_01550 [Omnitrophica WOR_2 bacterium RIFOXYB2_FULL_38_16]|nr:MAG: hypothetical protein A2306_01550 [Omnitrophica WOR_2 bacterium RIFOXYB2_FULL_38_16]